MSYKRLGCSHMYSKHTVYESELQFQEIKIQFKLTQVKKRKFIGSQKLKSKGWCRLQAYLDPEDQYHQISVSYPFPLCCIYLGKAFLMVAKRLWVSFYLTKSSKHAIPVGERSLTAQNNTTTLPRPLHSGLHRSRYGHLPVPY